MIEHLLHAFAHVAEEKLNEGNELYEKKREEELKKEWQKINPELLQYSKIAKWLFS